MGRGVNNRRSNLTEMYGEGLGCRPAANRGMPNAEGEGDTHYLPSLLPTLGRMPSGAEKRSEL
jgi:hypothetical protein